MMSVAKPLDLEAISTTRRSGAGRLGPVTRKKLAIDALQGSQPISRLADEHDVSRKFVYQQRGKADLALDKAFSPVPKEDEVLFTIPVTKSWLQQVALTLILVCHSSYRGVQGFFDDVLDHSVSLGKVHDIAASAVMQARAVNKAEDLSKIRVGTHDEIFQGDPVLVGVDPFSTYCYLLAQESSRDGTTWGVHLLDLAERGLDLDYTVADAGKGLRAGQSEAWPETPCRGDVFHIVQTLVKLTAYLDNRAYGAIGTHENVERKMWRYKKQGRGGKLSSRLGVARQKETQAVELADDMRLLVQWLREDVLALVGPEAQVRRELYDFIVAEMRAREHLVPHRIPTVCTALERQRDNLLAFADEIDQSLTETAQRFRVSLKDVRETFEAGYFAPVDPRHWLKDSVLWKRLGPLYPQIRQAVKEVAERTVRASSMVENFNSRLRCYFFLRHSIGPHYLDLLRFFLNHRRYPRSRKESRRGKSPAELLKGEPLPHWLEQLGFTRFRRTA